MKRVSYALGAAVLALAGMLLLRAQDRDFRAPGTRQMVALLRQILDARSIRSDRYLNLERVRQYRQTLAHGVDFRAELQLRMAIAEELLQSGDPSHAVEELLAVREFVKGNRKLLPAGFDRQLGDQLAISYLRLGEQDNCVMHQGIESCLMPIKGSGVHRIQDGSRGAVREFTALLKADPGDLLSRWLLNIAYMTLGEHPAGVPREYLIPEKVFDSEYNIKRFPDVAMSAGVNVFGHSGGSIAEDFDGDGFIDLMVSSSAPEDQLRYFRNNGDGTFTDRTTEAGLVGLVGGLNLVETDFDNDGHPDVLVLRGAWLGKDGHYPPSLLHNRGDGTFEDVTHKSGLLSFEPTQTAAWADFDQDGWLDVFIGAESTPGDRNSCHLYRNNHDGTFTDVAAAYGLADLGFVKGVAWGDYNNDGLPDLYVSRLGAPNLLFRNTVSPSGRRSFTEVAVQAGVTEPRQSFATWFWDYDNDGWEDIFVAGYHASTLADIPALYLGMRNGAEMPRLYHNNHDGTFRDVTKQVGLDRVALVMGANFGDLDNDGFLDCYLGTGEPDYRALLPNRMFRNAGGKRFLDVTTSGGFGHLQKGHAISFADFDNDGDQDVFAKMGGAYEGDTAHSVLFENPGHGNHWLSLSLEGVRSNRAAVGARIHVRVQGNDGVRDIYRTVNTGGSFGGNPLRQEIGLGKAETILEVEVQWPASAIVQKYHDLALDSRYRIREGDPTAKPLVVRSFSFKK
jgi:FG-GAP-like repeat/ASPIC and UnbV